MTRDEADRFLRRLAHSALATDAMHALNLRNEADLTPEERARGERGTAYRDQPRPARRCTATGGKPQAESSATFRAPCAGPDAQGNAAKSRCPHRAAAIQPSREAHPSRDFRLRSEVK